MRLRDAATSIVHRTLKGDSDSANSVAFSPDGGMLASGSSDSTVRLWHAATSALHQTCSVNTIQGAIESGCRDFSSNIVSDILDAIRPNFQDSTSKTESAVIGAIESKMTEFQSKVTNAIDATTSQIAREFDN